VRAITWPINNACSNSDPLLQLTYLRIAGAAKHRTRVRQSLLSCIDIGQQPSWNSTQIAESNGRLSLGLSEQRVEVTGSCFLLSLMPRWFLIFCLVHRAHNVPSIKKLLFVKRTLFVTVSNTVTTAKTADVRVEGQMAKWNQSLDAL